MADDITKLTVKQRCSSFFRFHWRGAVLFVLPIILLPLLFLEPVKAMRCAYILCIMTIFWITEAIPISMTSLMPIVAWPLMGIASSLDTCLAYFKDIVVFFMVSMVIALAIESSRLHVRIALNIISLVGCSPRKLHLSLTIVAFFVSFWISNSATTAMMCPIVKAILMSLDEEGLIKYNKEQPVANEDEPPNPSKVTICFFLTIAYATTIGGCATLIGTVTNLAFKGIYDLRYPSEGGLTFNSFFYFNIMPVLIIITLTCLWMQIVYLGLFRPNSQTAKDIDVGPEGQKLAKSIILQRRADLGPLSAAEVFTGILFILMVLLLFVRKPDIFPGYANILNEKFIGNSPPTILIAFLILAIPAKWAFCRYFRCRQPIDDKPAESILTWEWVQQKLPWSIFILLGGGFALSKGLADSGLVVLIGETLRVLENFPKPIIQLASIIASCFLTAFSSNVAIVNIMTPILLEIAFVTQVHPLYLVLPSGMVTSLAFHFPVSTPPNAIAAGFAQIRTRDMAIAGIGPSIFSILTYFIFGQTWAFVIFDNFGGLPKE